MRPYNEAAAPPVISNSLIPAGAGFGIRLAARVIDLGCVFVITFIGGIICGIVFAVLQATGKIGADWLEKIQTDSAASYFVGMLCAFLYHVCCEGIGGATPGKLILGLRVVQEDGRSCSFVGALKRDLAYHVDGLFFGLVGYNSMKKGPLQQRYGDKWGRTVVVQKKVFMPKPKPSVFRFLVGLFVGSVVLVGIIFADMLMKIF